MSIDRNINDKIYSLNETLACHLNSLYYCRTHIHLCQLGGTGYKPD